MTRETIGRFGRGMMALALGCTSRRDPPPRPPGPEAIDWNFTARTLRPGVYTFACAPGGSPGPIYGTDRYDDASSVCGAALHAGRVTRAGGPVTIVVRSGVFVGGGVDGTVRNGVRSLGWVGPIREGGFEMQGGPAPGLVAERVVPPRPPRIETPPGALRAEWEDTGESFFQGPFHKPLRMFCPPGERLNSFTRGANPYDLPSRVCAAAVHAGAITGARGGTFLAAPVPLRGNIPGSTANGIETSPGMAFGRGFSVRPDPAGRP